jgi:hypothetical protein
MHIQKIGFKLVVPNPVKVEGLDAKASRVDVEGGVSTSPSVVSSGLNDSAEADSLAGESVNTRLQPNSTSFETLRPSAMF